MYRIGVIGRDGEISDELRRIAEDIGRKIAENGYVLICGGRGGVMEAACKGARSMNGITVGILPSLNRGDANPYVDIVITTGMGHARNSLVVSSSDVVVAIDGRIGTLSEIALALNYGRPVIVIENTGGVSEFIVEKLKEIGIEGKIILSNPDDFIENVKKLIR
ncbi:MAG: TIGR00725 family protein [Candidatus Altiarchaeales archaeon]|nr:MAG: TIGR00725 family protein [Candidatus Altiarchaeales archaeon]RLI94087.1 MAG: TIGR00725 family protein [Candidatus Altiarchaeales archaeon]HDO82630.1 TIGR00725 family protein [Candidatus Altiarchaeales archaeon]HEX55279.1 TIGR00725 family protein [Candidatus Altiarchaeales archaeon]